MNLKRIVPICLFAGGSLSIPLIFLFSICIIVVFFFGFGSGGNVTNPGSEMAYANAVTVMTVRYNIPQPLELALIGWESGGNWRASGDNTNGTMDAGLCQVNSVNWATYNMEDNPYDVQKNLIASGSILSAGLRAYGNNWTEALYGYNGGSYENGLRYNPDYAPKVLGIFDSFASQPIYAKVVDFNSGSGDITMVIAAQLGSVWTNPVTSQSGKNFINPSYVNVQDVPKNASAFGFASPGDGILFSPEAILYHITLAGAQKGDDLKISVPGLADYHLQL